MRQKPGGHPGRSISRGEPANLAASGAPAKPDGSWWTRDYSLEGAGEFDVRGAGRKENELTRVLPPGRPPYEAADVSMARSSARRWAVIVFSSSSSPWRVEKK